MIQAGQMTRAHGDVSILSSTNHKKWADAAYQVFTRDFWEEKSFHWMSKIENPFYDREPKRPYGTL